MKTYSTYTKENDRRLSLAKRGILRLGKGQTNVEIFKSARTRVPHYIIEQIINEEREDRI